LHRESSAKPVIENNFYGQPFVDVTRCVGCGTCATECPSKSITMVEFEGKKHPMFHLDNCLFCFHCAESCPNKAITSSPFFELATTDKAQLAIDPQICTYSIEIQLEKKSQISSVTGTYKKKIERDDL